MGNDETARAAGGSERARRIFLLSPARCEGARASLLLRAGARFDLARRLRSSDGVSLGEAVQAIEKSMREIGLPGDIRGSFQGTAKAF